jgi:20S proteasome subunit beta 5
MAHFSMFELREQHEITVAAASKYLSNILYNYRGMGLSIGTMIAGFDKRGASIYRLDDGGDRQPITRLCSIGSGSLYAYSVLDQFYCAEMTDEEARDLGRRAIVHATYRDAGSGGSCNSK